LNAINLIILQNGGKYQTICKFNNKQNYTFGHVTFNNPPLSNHALPDVLNNILINITSGMNINEKETKEMLINFGTKTNINSVPI